MQKEPRRLWKIWMYALGSYNDESTTEYDNSITWIRTFLVGTNIVCAILIMANIIVGWVT